MPSVKEEMAAKVHKIVLTTFYYQHLQVLNQVLSSSFSTQNYITGVDFAICQVNDFEDISYKLQIWALAEHESFRSIARSYYNGSRLMLGVFAAHNSFESSFKVIEDHINDFQQQKSDVPAVLLVSDHLPTQLLDHFSLDKIRQFKIKYKIDYLHVIDPDDIEFESIWVKQWLLMIVLREEAHGGLELLQSRLMHRFAEKYPDAWKVCLQFMTVSFDQDQIIQALQPLNFVQLDRFFNLLVKFHPQQKLWVKAAYLQNARRLLYVALSRHNLSVAQRAYHLLTQHELISYNEVTTVDPLMWRIMADEFSFALQQHYVATEYNFSGHYFNDDDLEKIAPGFAKNPSIKKIDFSKNRFTSRGARHLISMLCRQSVTTLDFSKNQVGDDCADVISDYLSQSTAIVDLSLASNQLMDQTAILIGKALTVNQTLVRLNLIDNSLSYPGLIALLEGFTASVSMLELLLQKDCYYANNREGNYNYLVSRLIKQNYRPRKMDLSLMKMSEDYLMAMIYLLQKYNCPINELFLPSNPIGHNGAAYLAKYFSSNPAIKTLSLAGGGLSCDHFAVICSGLALNVSLENLFLSNNSIGMNGIIALIDAMSNNTRMAVLDISSNRLNAEAAVCVANFVCAKNSLQKLVLSNNPLTDMGANQVLLALLNSNNSLRDLYLSQVGMGDESCDTLGRLISKTATLSWLDVSKNDIGAVEKILQIVNSGNFPNKLRHINLSDCNMTDASLAMFINHLDKRNQLTAINLSYNSFSGDVFALLCELINHCPQLTSIQVHGIPLDKNYYNERFVKLLSWSKVIQVGFDTPPGSHFAAAIKTILQENKTKATTAHFNNVQTNANVGPVDIGNANDASATLS